MPTANSATIPRWAIPFMQPGLFKSADGGPSVDEGGYETTPPFLRRQGGRRWASSKSAIRYSGPTDGL